MNRDNIRKVANYIEDHPDEFDMRQWYKNFMGRNNTGCCIYGIAHHVATGEWISSTSLESDETVKQFLGIEGSMSELTVPCISVGYDLITPAIASAVLNHYANTGVIDWQKAIDESPATVLATV